jgi:hypothetical protein
VQASYRKIKAVTIQVAIVANPTALTMARKLIVSLESNFSSGCWLAGASGTGGQ